MAWFALESDENVVAQFPVTRSESARRGSAEKGGRDPLRRVRTRDARKVETGKGSYSMQCVFERRRMSMARDAVAGWLGGPGLRIVTRVVAVRRASWMSAGRARG